MLSRMLSATRWQTAAAAAPADSENPNAETVAAFERGLHDEIDPSTAPPETFDFDFCVIGGGSGGLAAAKRAALFCGEGGRANY